MMDAYVVMRSMKVDKQDDNGKSDFKEIEKKPDRKQKEEELRGWRRRMRINRRKEDEEWQKYRNVRIKRFLCLSCIVLSQRFRGKKKDEEKNIGNFVGDADDCNGVA